MEPSRRGDCALEPEPAADGTTRADPPLFRTALRALERLFEAELAGVAEDVRSFLAGGKTLRPRFLFACAADATRVPSDDAVIRAAAAIELVHAACLLHDDVVDRCAERRGRPAFHVTHGVQAAVEMGTHLVQVALDLTAPLPRFVRTRMAEVARVVARSELIEVARTFDVDVRPQERLVVMEEKTASVFALACELGSFLAGRPARARAAARDFGTAYGLLYQVADDLDDLYGSAEELGRAPGADLREGVVTVPLVYGLESPLRTEVIAVMEAARLEGTDPAAIARTQALLAKSGALDQVDALALRLTNRARARVGAMPAAAGRSWLLAMLEAVTSRVGMRLGHAVTDARHG